MFYFVTGCNQASFKNILKTSYILASENLTGHNRKFNRMTRYDKDAAKYIYCNIYSNQFKLKQDIVVGLGPIGLIISPTILNYKSCYVNFFWRAGVFEDSILMNDNIDYVLSQIKQMYRNRKNTRHYSFIMSHEALFQDRISLDFLSGVICGDEDYEFVKKCLLEYQYQHVKIYSRPPKKI